MLLKLQNAGVKAYTVSELVGESQTAKPHPTQITVKGLFGKTVKNGDYTLLN